MGWELEGRGFEVEDRDRDDGGGFEWVVAADGYFGGVVDLEVVEGDCCGCTESPGFLRRLCRVPADCCKY